MRRPAALGLTLSVTYLLACAALLWSQGLFGESFIAILLGFPWSFALAFIEFGNASGALLYMLVLAPLALNAVLLYALGAWMGRRH